MRSRTLVNCLTAAILILLASSIGFLAAQQKSAPPPQQKQSSGMACDGQDKSMAGMNKRGESAMGFSQTKTTHHFRLLQDGGVIEVEANQTSDKETINQIRTHLSHIAMMFAEGNFKAPMFIHDQTPPGVPTMQRLKSEITYRYQETSAGGRVLITSNNAEAINAIQEFLRFQIKEHETGDPLEVNKAS